MCTLELQPTPTHAEKPTEMEQRNFFDFTVEDEEESEEKWESPAELLKKRRQRARYIVVCLFVCLLICFFVVSTYFSF